MKRLTCSLLTFAMLTALLCGCGGGQAAPETTAAPPTLPTQTAAPAHSRFRSSPFRTALTVMTTSSAADTW